MNSQQPSKIEALSSSASTTETQVQAKKSSPRRSFSAAYKIKVLAAYDACPNALARGELLRKESLYHSRISLWRQQRDAGKFDSKQKNKSVKKVDQLRRENEQLKKQLAQAEAIIGLQKKVSDLLGQHILPIDSSESE